MERLESSAVGHCVLETIDEAPVRAQTHLFHDIFEGDELFDV